jgi:hypothetical protein
MALKNKSEISVINSPEFINLQPLDVNPLMSKCQIKVFYLGQNRNGSYINRETADEMAKTLRGVPIVASWYEDKEDYGDHGHVLHIENNEVSFSTVTVPYGFVSPDAEVWYQQYTDTDEFGNSVERTYLCTTGYLWTSQYEELTKVITEGQPQSMELDESTLDGYWAQDSNSGIEFFIINDATFSKLCILGDNVEPCFEGSSVEPVTYSLNDTAFTNTLFSMMNDLKDALQYKGGSDMPNEVEEAVEETVDFTEQEIAGDTDIETPAEDFAADEEASEETEEDFAAKEEASEEDEEKKDEESESEDEEEKPAAEHSLEDYEALVAENLSLKEEVESLREFKLGIENAQKDALINKYHMLSDEDKADVIAHKSEYSIEEIESKLALIYVQRNVDFETLTGESEEPSEDVSVTFSLDEEVAGNAVPSWVEALRHTKE